MATLDFNASQASTIKSRHRCASTLLELQSQSRGYGGRIDRSDPFSQGIGLIQPIIPHERGQLAVGVGHAQVIQINQIDGSNATARKRLGHPTADTPRPPRPREPVKTFVSGA